MILDSYKLTRWIVIDFEKITKFIIGHWGEYMRIIRGLGQKIWAEAIDLKEVYSKMFWIRGIGSALSAEREASGSSLEGRKTTDITI